jgi:hypothetical protein
VEYLRSKHREEKSNKHLIHIVSAESVTAWPMLWVSLSFSMVHFVLYLYVQYFMRESTNMTMVKRVKDFFMCFQEATSSEEHGDVLPLHR